MAAAKPVIVADHGGPSHTVIDEVGFRVPVSSPRELVSAIASALRTLAADEALRLRMAHAARSHVSRNYTWDGKADHLLTIYAQAVRDNAKQNSTVSSPANQVISGGCRPALSYA